MRTFEALLLFAAIGVPVGMTLDAARKRESRARELPAIQAVCAKLPSGSLALSGGARWLRSPATEEPTAAFSDAPASLDADPAGGLLAPPKDIWSEQQRRNTHPEASDALGSAP